MLLLSSGALVVGGLLLVVDVLVNRREPLAVRLARAEGTFASPNGGGRAQGLGVPEWLIGLRAAYERDLRRAGGEKPLRRFLAEKALLALAVPFIVLAPYAAATARPPTPALMLLLALAGFFVPDLLLRQEVR